MPQISKVKLMDSGTALFKASSRASALEILRHALLAGGGTVTEEESCFVLDFSTVRHWLFIQARLEETAIPGTWAAVLRTGDSPRLLPWDFPSLKAVRRTREILAALERRQEPVEPTV